MQMYESTQAARTTISDLDLADYDEEFEYHQALVSDEAFAAAARLYQQASLYADHEDAVAANDDAVDALRRAVRGHAKRVRGEVSDDV